MISVCENLRNTVHPPKTLHLGIHVGTRKTKSSHRIHVGTTERIPSHLGQGQINSEVEKVMNCISSLYSAIVLLRMCHKLKTAVLFYMI